jgi:hypothetical protein
MHDKKALSLFSLSSLAVLPERKARVKRTNKSAKNWRFPPNCCYFLQKFDHNIGFQEKRQFFRPKLSKIVENCDIEPPSYIKSLFPSLQSPTLHKRGRLCIIS